MKTTKDTIVNTAIDLFAEHGVRDVSVDKIAEKLGVTKGSIYHHFQNGKDEILDHILGAFDDMIADIKNTTESAATDTSTEKILSNLLLAFNGENTERGRKINRIIFADYVYVKKIEKYLKEVFYQRREAYFVSIFNLLVSKGKVKSFDTATAASILNRIFISYALEDTFYYPFDEGAMPPKHDAMIQDCKFIVNQILSGRFHN
jgi:AcrR family transcriptional regulator